LQYSSKKNGGAKVVPILEEAKIP